MAVDQFANRAVTNVTSGGTDAPASGTPETWTVVSSSGFPAAATGSTQFRVVDQAQPTEIILVTNVSGATWTVTRGAESTTPVAHSGSGFTVYGTFTAAAMGQLKVADWLNAVTMFGADPAGTSDSTAAIQSALNAAANGQPVYLPAGTYQTSSPLTLPPGSVLLGSSGWDNYSYGDAGAAIKPSAAFAGNEVLYMSDVSSASTQGSIIRGLGIDGSALTVTADGIRAFGPVHGAVLQDVFISAATGWGINQLTDSGATGNTCPYQWDVRHVRLHECAGGGANLPAHTDSTWDDVYVLGCGGTSGHGVAITGAPSNSHFTNVRAEWTGTGDGFHLTGAWNTGTGSGPFTMTACSTDRNQQNGFYCNATGYAPAILSNCMFRRDGRNSKSGGGGYAGIQLASSGIPVLAGMVTVFPGTDDDGTGTLSPQYGASVAGSTYAQILSGYLQGASAGVNGTVGGGFVVAPNVIVASGSTGGPSTQLTDFYRQSSGIIQTDNDIQVPAGFVSAQRFNIGGLTGATAGCRLAGAIASGTQPVSGTFLTGDVVIILTGGIAICTAGGTQGTWTTIT